MIGTATNITTSKASRTENDLCRADKRRLNVTLVIWIIGTPAIAKSGIILDAVEV